MSKIYNTQHHIATNFANFLKNVFPNIRKTQLNILPYIVFGMISAESSVASDIAKHLKDHFSFVQLDSVVRRIRRFFNNSLFDPYSFYDAVIKFVISSFKPKHPDKRIHIVIDHMFSHDNYSVLMFSFRIGKQGVPIWFRCFKDRCNPFVFKEDLIIQGINYVSSLFDSSYDLIFLADRWFNSISLMNHIQDLGHSFCFRLKKIINIDVFDKREKHIISKSLDDLFVYKDHSYFLYNVPISKYAFHVNLAISKSDGVTEPWIIATNADPKRAVKDYGYRFGAIECLFKNHKSNGFYIESINNASITSFTNMYTLVCFASLYLTILGTDFSKNSRCYTKTKITTHKVYKGNIKKRVLSLFNTGLTLFKLAFNSPIYIRLPFNFILYDI